MLVSRLDAGHALQNAERVDLYELVHTECQHYPEATLFALPINITAQPKLLTQLVRNLLNNAMIHGIPPIQVYLYHAMTTDDAHTIPQALLELDDDGGLVNAQEAVKSAREEWAEYIVKSEQQGASTPTPPANNGGGTAKTKGEIMKIKNAAERQKAIAENAELFGLKE